jgi:hypothetical protein
MALGFAISFLSKNSVKDIHRVLSLRNQGLSCVQKPILVEQLLKNPDLIYFFSNYANFLSETSSLIIEGMNPTVLRNFIRFGI